jgi:hypothetical protein
LSRLLIGDGTSKKELTQSMKVKAKVGDRIHLEAERVGQHGRAGVVEEVLASEPLRLRVRWDDGHSSVVAPASGAALIESVSAPSKTG